MKLSKEEFMDNVYDNLMKNKNHNPIDFAKIDDECFIKDRKEIYIGKFVLKVEEVAK